MASEPLTDAEAKLRNIVSHATGGSSQDAQASLNDICVRISQHHNRVWEKAQEVARKESADRIASLEAEVAALREADHLLRYARPLVGIARSSSDSEQADNARLVCQRIDALLNRGDGNG